jgi:hypothetical protein
VKALTLLISLSSEGLVSFFFCSVFDKLLNLYYSVSRVLLRPLGGVIFISVGCFITLFTLCPFVTKRGSNCYFGPRMYFETGQVIFVPEWPKGEFVSILALFYVWTKSLMCNDAVNRDSTFRVMSEDSACKSEEFQAPCQPSGQCVIPSGRPSVYCSILRTMCHSVWTSDRQASSVWMMCFFRPDTYIVSRSFCASLLRPDVSTARPDAYQFLNGSLILSKFQERKDQSIVRTMWYPVRMRISVRQESQFKMNRPNI